VPEKMADGTKSAIATGISVVIDVLQMIKRDRDQFMNKTALIDKMAEKAVITKIKAKVALDTFLDLITESLKKHESVQLVGFGTFRVKHRDARNARNPQTGETIALPAGYAPSLNFAQSLKDALKGSQSVETKTKLAAPVKAAPVKKNHKIAAK